MSFAPTMKMSTYLVAFIVGPFEETAALDVDGVPLRIVYPDRQGPPHRPRARGRRVRASILRRVLRHPLPRRQARHGRDPRLRPGAMENLGCITYRETALLVDPATASLAEMQRVARWSPTRSPTCGSATSSRWSGGRGSG